MIETFLQDLRYGFRMLLKSPAFTSVAVLTLALGIGANTAMFSVVDSILIRALPYPHSEGLVAVSWTNPVRRLEHPVSYPNFTDWAAGSRSFEAMAAYSYQGMSISGDGDAEPVAGIVVTSDFFRVFATAPAAGRTFLPGERDPVAVISYGLWQRRFGGDRGIVGRAITLNSMPFVVAGVMPTSFDFPENADLWVPITSMTEPSLLQERGSGWLQVVGRLRPGTDLGAAQAEMGTISARLAQQYPGENLNWRVRLAPLQHELVDDARPVLLVLLVAVAFVLMISCANLAGLLFARGTARQQEVAIRTALGASQTRIVRQLLAESILLALIGGAVGMLLAYWGVEILATVRHLHLPRLKTIKVDNSVLAFNWAISLLSGAALGIAPALRASRTDLNAMLKESWGVVGRNSVAGVRNFLVVAEVALCVVLLTGAGLMIRSLMKLRAVDLGFNADHVATFRLSIYKRGSQPKPGEAHHPQLDLYRQVLERVRALPGVKAVGAIHTLPLSGSDSTRSFYVEGRPQPPLGQEPQIGYDVITPGYFEAMRIPVVRGRGFTERDGTDAPLVAIINQETARRFFPGEDPIGKRLQIEKASKRTREIVGIVGNVRHGSPASRVRAEMYIPLPQDVWPFMTFVVRTERDPASIFEEVRRQVAEVNKDQPVASTRTMLQVVADSIGQQRLSSVLLALLAELALLLAVIGLYGLISYSVSLRTHEMGIRIALGARTADLLGMVLGQGFRLTVVGLTVGVTGALGLTRFLAGMLFQVGSADLPTLLAVALLLGCAALLATYIPARRATRVDPMVALRYE